MPWLKLHAENAAFREGVTRGGGEVHQVGASSPNAYKNVIVYKMLPALRSTDKLAVANIDTFERLRTFVSQAATRLYELGVLK